MKKILIMLVFLFAPLLSAEQAKVERQPLKTMSTCLIMNGWSAWGIWQYDVYALARDKVLIGSKENHFLISSVDAGYSHVINGKTVAYYPEAKSLNELGEACQENCPVNYEKRVSWFQRRCKEY
ncbi:hypothetical protein ACJJIE_14180 [Microbulbifer sp. TRSA001]|uniref:hypothetical protein n=1 Tax=unclassified Microbulbifer TaxID=2619833 RepID=UPI0024ADE9FA|nr:hypothetical protein [Microbulbifer sp. VAAF005]WHI45433.1 hypothetical protein P0078_17110 [Microbulbifer sp. VAAF005]